MGHTPGGTSWGTPGVRSLSALLGAILGCTPGGTPCAALHGVLPRALSVALPNNHGQIFSLLSPRIKFAPGLFLLAWGMRMWRAHGVRHGAWQGAPHGCSVDIQWTLSGCSMDAQWMLFGCYEIVDGASAQQRKRKSEEATVAKKGQKRSKNNQKQREGGIAKAGGGPPQQPMRNVPVFHPQCSEAKPLPLKNIKHES